MLEMRDGDTLFLSDGVMLHSVPREDWYYAFSVVTGDQFRLNGPSFWILEAIGGGMSWGALRKAFLEEYDVEVEKGREDLVQTVAEFVEQGLVGRQANAEDQEAV